MFVMLTHLSTNWKSPFPASYRWKSRFPACPPLERTNFKIQRQVLTGGPGWTVSAPGHLHTAPSFCRAHGDVTMGNPEYQFVNSSYYFPQYWMPYRLSVGAGLFTIFFQIGNKNTWERISNTIFFLLKRELYKQRNRERTTKKFGILAWAHGAVYTTTFMVRLSSWNLHGVSLHGRLLKTGDYSLLHLIFREGTWQGDSE